MSNGLFGSPLMVELASNEAGRSQLIGSFLRANVIYCLLGAGALLLLVIMAGGNPIDSLLASVLGALMWFRWFVRSTVLALGRRTAAASIDLTYGVTSLLALLALSSVARIGLTEVVVVQILGGTASLVPEWRELVKMFGCCIGESTAPFRRSFLSHGRWSITSIVATQIAVNSHVYLITLLVGAAAFAPLALAALLFRPMGVVLTGLVQYEQSRMAKNIARLSLVGLEADVAFVRAAVIAAWLGNASIALCLALVAPSLVVRDGYDIEIMKVALLLTGLTVLLRGLREPMGTALQAAGQFKSLARITALSAPGPLIISGGLVVLFPSAVVLTLVGAVVGEALGLYMVRRRYVYFRACLRSDNE